jgi:glutamine cyclotransferase
MKRSPIFLSLSIIIFSCSPDKKKDVAKAKENLIPFTVVKVFPHDKNAFTQGLAIDQGKLFESTGRENSWIAEVDIASGKEDKKVVLDKKYFGEGITVLHNNVYQLTWQNHVAFVYDLRTFQKIKQFKIAYEGWGITSDGKSLIVSDGTEKLHFLDTVKFVDKTVISVHDANGPISEINELEFIDGYIFANQWQTTYILKIDPLSGEVKGKIDFTPIADKVRFLDPNADVLNGIAYEKKTKTLLITGKLWSALYAIRLK